MRVGGGGVNLNTLKVGGKEKTGGEKDNFKKWRAS